MGKLIRTADNKGRVALPGFANATVIVEALGKNEYRVRRAEVVPTDDVHFPEEDFPLTLSKRDSARLADILARPPQPNAALRRAMKRQRKHHG